MAQTSVQYTPVQVLQAARRAEAEGKMDYALQFYRHIVEHHGTTAEAQEAREGLFRIAEWRWGEARIARRQEAAVANGYGGQQRAAVAVAGGQPQPAYAPELPDNSVPITGGATRMPQIIAREAAKAAEGPAPAEARAPRYRIARIAALVLSGCGWASVAGGIIMAVMAMADAAAAMSAAAFLGLPLGVLLGGPVAVIGLVLIVTGYLAVAVFESSNATLELADMRRRRAG
jgi:hypothetical protein